MEEDLADIKAKLLLNTKTRKRKDNLYDIANIILKLKNYYGSLDNVRKEVTDISTNMLNRFLSVLNVDKKILPFIINRKIDSVNAIYYIQTLEPEDQYYIAKQFISKKINAQDIRALRPMKRKYPKKDLDKLLNIILASKNKKRYLVKFDKNSTFNKSNIENKLRDIIKEADFEIKVNNKIVTIIFSENAYTILKNYLNEKNITQRKYFTSIMNN